MEEDRFSYLVILLLMTSRERAISITQDFLNSKGLIDYEVDEKEIVERESAWYIPFKEKDFRTNKRSWGSFNGLIVDRNSEEFMQPGSALSLDDWIYGFEIGLRGKIYDLKILKVNHFDLTVESLLRIGLVHFKIEVEYGTEWTNSTPFKKFQIGQRLEKLPCIFKHQSFHYEVNEFKRIHDLNLFEYELVPAQPKDYEIL